MHYIHNSPIQVHGNLKSSNVVIDNRWTCKVTDHDLRQFKAGQQEDVEAGVNAKYYGNSYQPIVFLGFKIRPRVLPF